MIMWRFDNINKMPEEAGIYMIINILNNHKYIGSTNNFKRRLTRHRAELRKDRHHSLYLQRAYNKYGEDKFLVYILEKCSPIKDTLIFLEQKYLDLNPEYNIEKIADRRFTKQTKLKVNRVKHAVQQYDLNGVFIREFDSITQAAKWCGNKNKHPQISMCCQGKLIQACGYLWKYKNDDRDVREVVKTHCNKGIKVDQLDLNGKYIRTFDNMRIAAESIGSVQNISAINRVCRGQKKTAFGFKWKYHKDNNYDK